MITHLFGKSRRIERTRSPVQTEISEIRATRALMRVRSHPAADCTRHLADAIMHAHVACGYFGRSVVACNFGLRQSYVRGVYREDHG